MSLVAEVGQFTLNATTGNQTVTLSNGSLTPVVVIFWSADKNSDGIEAASRYFIGFAVSATSRATIASGANDAVAASNNVTQHDNTKCLFGITGGNSVQFAADFVSFAAGQFTVNVTTAKATKINYMVLGGTGISASVIQLQAPTSNGSQSYAHGLASAPTALLAFGGVSAAAPPDAANIARIVFGMWGGSAMYQGTAFAQDNATTMIAKRTAGTGKFLDNITTSQLENVTAVTTDATNVNLTWANTAIARYYWVLAIAGCIAKTISSSSPTAGSPPVSQSITGVGFTPVVALFTSVMRPTAAGIQADSRQMFGGSDAIRNYSAGGVDQDAIADSNCDMFLDSDSALKMIDHAQTEKAAASVTAFGSDGATLSWSAIDGSNAYEFSGLYLGNVSSTFTATAGLVVSAATLSGSATFAPGTKTATASLMVSPATLSGSATFATQTYTASAALNVSPATLAALATFTSPIYAASAALSVTPTTLAGSATFTGAAGTFTASGILLVSAATLSGLGDTHIVARSVLSESDTSNVSSYVSSSWTPQPNTPYLVEVHFSKATAITGDATLSGNGLTWALVDSQLFASSDVRYVAVFLAKGVAVPTPGPITITAPSAMTGAIWSVIELKGEVDLTDVIVVSNVKKSAVSSATSITNTMNAFGNPANAVISFAGRLGAEDFIQESGWRQLASPSMLTPTCRIDVQIFDGVDTTATHAWTNATSAAAISIEIKAVVTVFTAAATLGVSPATLAGSAEFDAPIYSASAGLVASAAELDGTALFAAAISQAVGTLIVSGHILAGVATHVTPTYATAGTLVVAPATLAGIVSHITPVYTGVGVLLVSGALLNGMATFSSGTVTATANLNVSAAILSAAATFTAILVYPTIPGTEFEFPSDRLHYEVSSARLQYDMIET